MRHLCFVLLFSMLVCLPVMAESDAIFTQEIKGAFESTYDKVYKALEESRFYVIFEVNIGKNLARNAERWGEDYNRNQFEEVRSMVICNPWYANQVLNKDPKYMALCPLTVTLLYKNNTTQILFEKLTTVAKGSAAEDILWEVENTIITAIEGVSEK